MFFCAVMKAASNKSAQIYLSEVESRTQGSKPRPKTQKVFEAKDRPSRGQGHRRRCSPNNNKKKVFKFFFQAISKKRSSKIFSGDLYMRKPKKGLCRFSARFLAFSNETSTVQKCVLEDSTSVIYTYFLVYFCHNAI